MTVQDTEAVGRSAPKVYKSPQRKLVRFFEKSRDQWKAKCREAKTLVRRLKNRVRWLERSRDRWKQQAQALDTELARVKAEATVRQQELEAALAQEKKRSRPASRTAPP